MCPVHARSPRNCGRLSASSLINPLAAWSADQTSRGSCSQRPARRGRPDRAVADRPASVAIRSSAATRSIIVSKYVADAGNPSPRDVRVARLQVLGKVTARLGDDVKRHVRPASDCVQSALNVAKRDIGRRTADVLDHAAFARSIIRKPGSQMPRTTSGRFRIGRARAKPRRWPHPPARRTPPAPRPPWRNGSPPRRRIRTRWCSSAWATSTSCSSPTRRPPPPRSTSR